MKKNLENSKIIDEILTAIERLENKYDITIKFNIEGIKAMPYPVGDTRKSGNRAKRR